MGNHTESVDIEYDPKVTSYSNMLDIFWKNHDPTTSKCSRQYMSAIFYHNEVQKRLAKESKEQEAKKRSRPINTEILSGKDFYEAENYHQKYLLQSYPRILSQLDIEPGEQLVRSFVATRLNGYIGGYGSMKAFENELEQLALPPQVEQSIKNQISNKKRSDIDC
ncbi:Peptide methionine sulfoxide reductase [Folsomia candida]|uniref:peptide-methionine (S)-S-oxide reductase n=2 Tax=Folsomia candida TaxID=158441 RepID=A0A226ENJ3_FOLCA|nr:Peptide methionine sulfoxide reductase [Folsomia candida]